MQHFFLIRHGQSLGQALNSVHDASTPMTDEGRRQIYSLLPFLQEQKITRVYTSPFRRAAESAEIIASALGVPLIEEADFSEWNYHGNFHGTWEEHRQTYPWVHVRSGQFKPDFCVPGGESFNDFYSRVSRKVGDYRKSTRGDQQVVFVSHFCALNVITNTFLNLAARDEFYFDFANGSVSKISVKCEENAKLSFSNRFFY